MAAIHPRAAAWHDNGPTREPPSVSAFNRGSSARSRTLERTKLWRNLLRPPRIPQCIVLSRLRCVFTLFSLTLLVTDIPRTGLGIRNLQEFYPLTLMPSTAVRFGPFDYPVMHIWRLPNANGSSTFAGRKGSQAVTTARAWPYQFDTLSVAIRGAVELLNVTEFPRYLRYKPEKGEPTTNGESLVGLEPTFAMLDALIDAAHVNLLPEDGGEAKVLRFATKHNWIDRIHHYVVRFASTNPAWRLHSLHIPLFSRTSQSVEICSRRKASSLRPRFCNHPGIWKVAHPVNAELPAVRLWDHIDLRLQLLRQRYSHLELEVALLSSQRLSSTSGAMRSTYFSYEALEVTVLTRGRRCTEKKTNCSTVFVDDYRYERDTVQTNLVEWYGVIALLRGGAQAYVWIRLLLLIYGAYTAAGQLALYFRFRLRFTLSIVFRIPFEVVVYSSLLPVSGYVVAQVLDSSFMDIFLDSYWAAVGGSIQIDLVTFLRSTAVQMRNVWLLALLVTVTVFAVRKTRDYWGEGLPAIRGLVITFTSTLTVFGPYKKTTQRDTNILSLFLLPDESQTMDIVHGNPVGHYNVSTYVFDDSAVMLLFCIGVVVAMAAVVKALALVLLRSSEPRDVILSSTPTIPCGTHRLWLASVLSVQFFVRPRFPRALPAPKPSLLPVGTDQTKVRPFESFPGSASKRSSQRTLLGEAGYDSAECRSIVQLMNIAMMTDPWNFFWLRVLGVQLYLYKVRSVRGLDSFALILPFAEDEIEDHTGLSSNDIQLLDTASSRDVPMSVLLQAG
ncbi:hypothetical protein V7S43_012220 [Phytophthora oleae]|uniref:Piezo non-specific cation channel R-Ras-binding domain-containing protein n=1 Tax=Phytophthora oleae TaxID=2107226 RepID=A0ABD3F933_9STRA